MDISDSQMQAMVNSAIRSAVEEAAARSVALALIREHGVTVPLRALQNAARPLMPLEKKILAKLEVVATVLGSP